MRQVVSAAPCAFAKVVDPPVGEVLAFWVPWGTIRPPTLRWRVCWLPSGCSHSRREPSCPWCTDRLRAVGWFLGAAAPCNLYVQGRDGVSWKLTFVMEFSERPAVPCQLFDPFILVFEEVDLVGQSEDCKRLKTLQAKPAPLGMCVAASLAYRHREGCCLKLLWRWLTVHCQLGVCDKHRPNNVLDGDGLRNQDRSGSTQEEFDACCKK